jgi:hypothetical protein
MSGMSTSAKLPTQVVDPRQKTDASLRSAQWKLKKKGQTNLIKEYMRLIRLTTYPEDMSSGLSMMSSVLACL